MRLQGCQFCGIRICWQTFGAFCLQGVCRALIALREQSVTVSEVKPLFKCSEAFSFLAKDSGELYFRPKSDWPGSRNFDNCYARGTSPVGSLGPWVRPVFPTPAPCLAVPLLNFVWYVFSCTCARMFITDPWRHCL